VVDPQLRPSTFASSERGTTVRKSTYTDMILFESKSRFREIEEFVFSSQSKPIRFYLKILRFVDKPEFCDARLQRLADAGAGYKTFAQ